MVLKAVALLIQYGVKLDEQNNERRTPLDYALSEAMQDLFKAKDPVEDPLIFIRDFRISR